MASRDVACRTILLSSAMVVLLAGCAGGNNYSSSGLGGFLGSDSSLPSDPVPIAETAASIQSQEIVGRWGLAAYHKSADRPRTEAAARAGCRQPYVISAGGSGGVIMHLADEAQPQELRLKGSPDGKNYIGPPGPGGEHKDREIVSFNGSMMQTRFIDPDAATRYGTMVYVRCTPRA